MGEPLRDPRYATPIVVRRTHTARRALSSVRSVVSSPDVHADRFGRDDLIQDFPTASVRRGRDRKVAPNRVGDVAEVPLALPVSVQIDGARGGQQSPVEARQPSLLDPGPAVPDLEPPAEPKHQLPEPPGRGSG